MDNDNKMIILITFLIAEIATIIAGIQMIITPGTGDIAKDFGWSIVVSAFILAIATLYESIQLYYEGRIFSKGDFGKEILRSIRDYIVMLFCGTIFMLGLVIINGDNTSNALISLCGFVVLILIVQACRLAAFYMIFSKQLKKNELGEKFYNAALNTTAKNKP